MVIMKRWVDAEYGERRSCCRVGGRNGDAGGRRYRMRGKASLNRGRGLLQGNWSVG